MTCPTWCLGPLYHDDPDRQFLLEEDPTWWSHQGIIGTVVEAGGRQLRRVGLVEVTTDPEAGPGTVLLHADDELTVDQARELAELLLEAVDVLKAGQ